jgi:hypothetical protein
MGNETDSRLSDSIRKVLLRDAGHAPEDRHPDGHFRRALPIQPHEVKAGTLPNPQPPTPVDIRPAG